MSREEPRLGPTGRRTLIVALGVLLLVWALVVVAWPRLSLGTPLSRQVAMSTVPVHDGDGARCRVGFVASWYDDRVNYYASTGCEGLDVAAVTVTIDGPDGHSDTFGCRDEDQLLLACSTRELEGSVHCGDECDETTLNVLHRAHLPPATQLRGLEPTACAFGERELSCSYPVTLDTVSVANAWSFEGRDYLCVTRPVGEQRIELDAISELEANKALVQTPTGTAVMDATAEAVESVLAASGGLPEVSEDDHPSECDDDAPET